MAIATGAISTAVAVFEMNKHRGDDEQVANTRRGSLEHCASAG